MSSDSRRHASIAILTQSELAFLGLLAYPHCRYPRRGSVASELFAKLALPFETNQQAQELDIDLLGGCLFCNGPSNGADGALARSWSPKETEEA